MDWLSRLKEVQKKEALRKYNGNKLTCILYGDILPVNYLCRIAKEQDELYKIIHREADSKNFDLSGSKRL